MVGLDTSVVVRLLIGEPVGQAEAARAFLDELFEKRIPVGVSDLVVGEAYFALQHHYAVPKAKVIGALRTLFDSGEVIAMGSADVVLKTRGLARAKPGFVDRMIHAEYLQSGEMATFEKKAGRLVATRVISG